MKSYLFDLLNVKKIWNVSLLNWSFLVIILILWIVLQTQVYNLHQFPLTRGETDGIGYMNSAKGPLFHVDDFHGPGYSLGIRGVNFVTGLPLFESAKITSILFGIIYIFSSWALLSKIHGEKELPLLLVLIAANPVIIVYSNMILSDMMAAALFIVALAFLIIPNQPKFIHFIISGLIAGLAYLTRYVYVVLVLLPFIITFFRQSNCHKKNILKNLLGFLIAFGLMVLPWSLFLHYQKGSPFWNLNHLNIAFNMYREGMGWNVFPSETDFPNLISVIRSSPFQFFYSWWESFVKLPFQTMSLFGRIGYFACLGFFIWLGNVNYRKVTIFIIFVILSGSLSLVWFESRFVLPLIPFIASFIISGIQVIPQKIKLDSLSVIFPNKEMHLRFIVILITIIATLFQLKTIPNYFQDQAKEYETAIEWLKVQPHIDESNIIASKPHIPYFIGAEWTDFRKYSMQNKSLSELPDILRQVNPDYLIIDQRYAGVEFPQFAILLEPENQPFKDILADVFETSDPLKLVIYKYIE